MHPNNNENIFQWHRDTTAQSFSYHFSYHCAQEFSLCSLSTHFQWTKSIYLLSIYQLCTYLKKNKYVLLLKPHTLAQGNMHSGPDMQKPFTITTFNLPIWTQVKGRGERMSEEKMRDEKVESMEVVWLVALVYLYTTEAWEEGITRLSVNCSDLHTLAMHMCRTYKQIVASSMHLPKRPLYLCLLLLLFMGLPSVTWGV